MLSRVVLLLVLVLNHVFGSSPLLSVQQEQHVSINVELLEWDLEVDSCGPLQEATWKTLLLRDNDDKINALCSSADLQRRAAEEARPHLDEEVRSQDLSRRIKLLSHPGLPLLPSSDFKQVAELMVRAESLQRSPIGLISYGTENITLAEVDDLMSRSRDPAQLTQVWLAWQRVQQPSDLQEWPRVLELQSQAAQLNEFGSVDELWEMQSEWSGGYTVAEKLWSEIEPLYRKFQGYVRRRLQERFPDVPHPIPIHLLGSTLGHDWSYVADILLPQPEMYTEINKALQQQGLGGESAYARAREMSEKLGLPPLGDDFMTSSVFNDSCPTMLISNCSDDNVKVFTCDEISWQRYLEAHETTFRAAHEILVAEDNSYLFRHAGRISGLAEGFSGVGSLLATADVLGSLLERDGSDPLGQASNLLMLVALKVLPRLPAFLAADKCRLSDAPHPSPSPAYLCWPIRRRMQGVSPPSIVEDETVLWDSLADPHFTSHTPYLSEFAGLFLQFQLLERLTKNTGLAFFSQNLKQIKIDDKLRAVLSKGYSLPWPSLLSDLDISDVSSDALLRFFSPLAPIFDDLSPVKEIPIEEKVDDLVQVTSSLEVTSESSFEVVDNSTLESEDMMIDQVEPSDMSTTFIAIAGIVLGVTIVIASLCIVNRRRKSVRLRRNIVYNPVLRHSVGRPASFSPVAAKRLSENDAPAPPPILTTFRECDNTS